VQTGEHLVYVDLNMVRAAVVRHPVEWSAGGYREIQSAPERYRIVDRAELGEIPRHRGSRPARGRACRLD